VCEDERLLKYEKKKGSNVKASKNYPGIVKAKVLGCCTVIKRANAEIFGDLLKDLRKQHSYGQYLYPDSVEVAHSMLNKHELLYEKKKKHEPKGRGEVGEKGYDDPRGKYQGQQYAQQDGGRPIKGKDTRIIPHIT